MAYNKLNLEEEIKPSSLESAKHFNVGIYNNQNIELIAISEEAPTEYVEGDKYYNKTDKLIHIATENGFDDGEVPIRGAFYIVIEQQGIFYYNGDDLISVGGGTSGGDGLPVGAGTVWFSDVAPKNYLICDGSVISRTKYKKLFETIGTTYGEGDGSTTFNLPKVDGKTLVGLDSIDEDFNVLGKTIGEKKHKLTIDETPEHDHDLDKACSYSEGIPNTKTGYGFDQVTINRSSYPSSTNYTGGGQPHNNIQPSMIVNYIIKALDDTILNDKEEVLDLICPIGKIEIFFDNEDHSNYLGFTWERELVGMTAVGLDTAQEEFNAIGKTGGSKYLQKHTHQLKMDENNVAFGLISAAYSGERGWAVTDSSSVTSGGYILFPETSNAGEGNSENLQPYKVVAYWKRIA